MKLEKRKKKKHKRVLITVVSIIFLIAFFGFNQALKTQKYTVVESNVTDSIKIALIADLHSCKFGENEKDLIEAIEIQSPDLVMLGGDIVDDEIADTYAIDLVKAIGTEYPCYYVTGNHEIWSQNAEEIKEKMRKYGVTVLDGQCTTIVIRGQEVNVAGVDDPSIGNAKYQSQVEECARETDFSKFTIFLTHRPERVDMYMKYGFTFILAGHAHGGQWRIPPFCNGVYAPSQGWWPRYVGGDYKIGDTDMIVSRGLARETNMLPRFFNQPELVIINVVPD